MSGRRKGKARNEEGYCDIFMKIEGIVLQGQRERYHPPACLADPTMYHMQRAREKLRGV